MMYSSLLIVIEEKLRRASEEKKKKKLLVKNFFVYMVEYRSLEKSMYKIKIANFENCEFVKVKKCATRQFDKFVF